MGNRAPPAQRNLDGGPLQVCSRRPQTGAARNGYCTDEVGDHGRHVVCATVDDAFLNFTRARGNDLTTPRGDFSGLQAGDRWCLCAGRYEEARAAGVKVAFDRAATNAKARDYGVR